jgi:hypothetical protein
MKVSPQSLFCFYQADTNLAAGLLRGVVEGNADAVPTSSISM